MGKNLMQQTRGRGVGFRYRVPSFRYMGVAKMRNPTQTSISGTIMELKHCPGHSAPLARITFDDGKECLVQAPEGCRVGDKMFSGIGAPVENGNMLTLKEIPEGTLIYNVESVPGDGGKFCRTSGTAAKLLSKFENNALVELPSKKQRQFSLDCRATIGIIAGAGRTEKPFLKAGKVYHAKRARNKKYPSISGAAQNAVDHPFGNKRTSRKAKQRPAPKFACAGRKVGKLHPRRTGRKS
jgi:large subunit ribosomal protein L2